MDFRNEALQPELGGFSYISNILNSELLKLEETQKSFSSSLKLRSSVRSETSEQITHLSLQTCLIYTDRKKKRKKVTG